MEHPFTFFQQYFGADHHNLHIYTAVFVGILLTLATALVYPRLRDAKKNVVPSKTFNLQVFFELIIEMLASLADDIIGHHSGRKYVPYVGTIFIFIFACNMIGLIPGFLPATEAWVTGASVATIVFIGFNMFGFQVQGPGYVKHFLAPISLAGVKNVVAYIAIFLPLAIFQVVFVSIELISTFFRPITLSIRLFVNISADHMVLGAFSHLVPYLVPIPFMLLGIFVSFMQAFIFTLLTMVYISLAVAHDHE